MEKIIDLSHVLKKSSRALAEYESLVVDLLGNDKVRSMRGFIQHGKVTCLEHCILVSYLSYLACKKFGLDYRAAARGGLLHDMFLYDWHEKNSHCGLHAFSHPGAALHNAENQFVLSSIEKDIISRHMWPLTPAFPKSKEAVIVSFADKYCALIETKQNFRMPAFPFIRRRKYAETFSEKS